MSEQTEREAFEAWRVKQPWYIVTKPEQGDELDDGSVHRIANIAASEAWSAALAASAAVRAAPAPLSREVMEAAAIALEQKAWMDGLCVDPQADEDAATIRASLAAPPDTYSTMLEALRTALQAFREIRHARTNPNWFTHGERGATMQRLMWEQRGLEAVQSAIDKATAPAAPTEPVQRPGGSQS